MGLPCLCENTFPNLGANRSETDFQNRAHEQLVIGSRGDPVSLGLHLYPHPVIRVSGAVPKIQLVSPDGTGHLQEREKRSV